MNAEDAMRRIDTLLSHVWMVRAFLKHLQYPIHFNAHIPAAPE